jgi:hypothetical protein
VPIQIDRFRGVVVAALVLAGLVQIALWVWMAEANRAGKAWARVTSTAFFGISTLGTFIALTRPGDGTSFTKLFGAVGWLIGCAAIALLWQPQSNAYFKRR